MAERAGWAFEAAVWEAEGGAGGGGWWALVASVGRCDLIVVYCGGLKDDRHTKRGNMAEE